MTDDFDAPIPTLFDVKTEVVIIATPEEIARERKREHWNQYMRRYYKAHPEVARKAAMKWRKAHPDKVKEIAHRAYLNRVETDPTFKAELRENAAKWYAKHKDDPEFKRKAVEKVMCYRARHPEAIKRMSERICERYRTDPEFHKKLNAASLAYYNRHKNDPEFRAKNVAASVTWKKRNREKVNATRRRHYHAMSPEKKAILIAKVTARYAKKTTEEKAQLLAKLRLRYHNDAEYRGRVLRNKRRYRAKAKQRKKAAKNDKEAKQ